MCCNYTFIWFVTCYILTSCPIYLIIYCVYNIQNALGKYIYIYLLCCQNVDNSPSQTSRDRWVVPCDLGPDVVDGHYPELIPFFTPVPIPPRCWSISESHIWSVDVRELMCREKGMSFFYYCLLHGCNLETMNGLDDRQSTSNYWKVSCSQTNAAAAVHQAMIAKWRRKMQVVSIWGTTTTFVIVVIMFSRGMG